MKHFDKLLIPQNVHQHPNQNDWTNIIILMKKNLVIGLEKKYLMILKSNYLIKFKIICMA